MNKKITLGAVLLSSSLLFGFFGFGMGKDVIAKIGGEEITKTDLAERIKAYPPQFAEALKQKENKIRVLDQMIDEKLILAAAKKEGYEKNKEFKTQIQNAEAQLLVNLYVRDKIEKNTTVTDAEVRRFYDANPAQFQAVEQRKARHILVKSEAEAQAILKQLKGGADFVALAKQKSQDPTAQNGGDLGWFTKGQLVPDFERAVFALSKGKLSGVVRTQFGFHIIRLDDVSMRPKLDFEKVKGQIRDALVGEKKRALTADYLTKLKKEIKIKKDIKKID